MAYAVGDACGEKAGPWAGEARWAVALANIAIPSCGWHEVSLEGREVNVVGRGRFRRG